MKVHAIFEGRTEEKVLNRLERLADCSFELTPSDGKNKMRKTIVGLIGPLIGSGPIRVVILRDLDHDETIDQVVQRTTDALKQAFEGRNPSVVPQLDRLDDNVYVWRSADDLDIRVALHIATYRWNKAFIKTKIDDYILSIALQPDIATALAQHLGITGDHIIKKVTEEIPKILNDNGIAMNEAKDYVRLYAAIIKSHTSPSVFAEKVLNQKGIDENILRNRFASLFAALEFLRCPTTSTLVFPCHSPK